MMFFKSILNKSNPYLCMALLAIVMQTAMLVLFYGLPDPLGLSMAEMFEGKTLWQIFMAYGAILVMAALFGFARAPRGLAVFYALYFFVAAADYDVFRFSHQRLSYSFLRTYFHISNITDATTISTLGGDLLGTILWVSTVLLCFAGAIAFIVAYSLRLRNQRRSLVLNNQGGAWKNASKKVPVAMFAIGMALSLTPLVLFLTGTRGWIEIPVTHTKVDCALHWANTPLPHLSCILRRSKLLNSFTTTQRLPRNLSAIWMPSCRRTLLLAAAMLWSFRCTAMPPPTNTRQKSPTTSYSSWENPSRAASSTRCSKATPRWPRTSGSLQMADTTPRILPTMHLAAVFGSKTLLAAATQRCAGLWLPIWGFPRIRTATCPVSMLRISSRVGQNF